MPGFQFDTSWVFLSIFLFWAGAFEIAPQRFPDQGALFDGLVGTVVVLLYFLGVLIHEGGHKLAGWMTGCFYEGNLLTIWGGIPREAMSFEARDSRDRIVRMGGPIFNLILAFPLFHFASRLASHPDPSFRGPGESSSRSDQHDPVPSVRYGCRASRRREPGNRCT
jgi:hypothetical protein